MIDTLRLNPLAFPRNPYHHLVKHYQDGQFKRRQLNDPILDARLALEVFLTQRGALATAGAALLVAWHWLTTPHAHSAALYALFMILRQRPRPTRDDAAATINRGLAGQGCSHRRSRRRGSLTLPAERGINAHYFMGRSKY